MLAQHTIDQLRALRLDGMLAALHDEATSSAAQALPFAERLSLLVQREIDWRDERRLQRLLKAAKLKVSSACVQDIDWRSSRGLDRGHYRAGRLRLDSQRPQRSSHRRDGRGQDLAGLCPGTPSRLLRLHGPVRAGRAPARGAGGRSRRRQLLTALGATGQARFATDRRLRAGSDYVQRAQRPARTARRPGRYARDHHHQPIAGQLLARLAGRSDRGRRDPGPHRSPVAPHRAQGRVPAKEAPAMSTSATLSNPACPPRRSFVASDARHRGQACRVGVHTPVSG